MLNGIRPIEIATDSMTTLVADLRKKVEGKTETVKRDDLVQPFLKWAGGKRELVPTIREYVPRKYRLYFEPFVGAGAVLFDLQPREALVSDVNRELINCYNVIKNNPQRLIADLSKHPNTKRYFYKLRSLDREAGFNKLSQIKRASRIIYLNKTCYNGLFRVNSQGHFNVPYGNYVNPLIVDEKVINAVSRHLNDANVGISNDDFENALSGAGRGDFVYLDPPYDPLSDTSSFTGYDLNSFGREEQIRLKHVCDDLTRRGCKVLLSNSATPFIRKLYADKAHYTAVEVDVSRKINAVATARGKIRELLILNNYDVG
jgi:DNA adenine methylase